MSRLLLVDDNRGDSDLFTLAVEEAGWQPDLAVAEDGIAALRLLEAACRDGTTPDLAIIDLNMPRMNGWELLARMREIDACQSIHRVILTSSPVEADCERARGTTGGKLKALHETRADVY